MNRTETAQDVHYLVETVDSSNVLIDEVVSIPSEDRVEIEYSVPQTAEESVTVRGTIELVDPPDGLDEEDQWDEHEITFTGANDAWFSGQIREDGEIRLSRSEV